MGTGGNGGPPGGGGGGGALGICANTTFILNAANAIAKINSLILILIYCKNIKKTNTKNYYTLIVDLLILR